MKTLIQLIIIGIVIMCFSSCYNSKKATEQVNKANDKFPEVVAKVARDKYPCTEVLKPDTTVVYSDSLVFVEVECPDTIKTETVVKVDTVNNVITKTIRVPVNMPVQTKYITQYFEDSAKLFLLTQSINKANAANEKLQASNDTLQKKVSRKSKENWIWRVIALVFIGLFVWRKYQQLTTIKFK